MKLQKKIVERHRWALYHWAPTIVPDLAKQQRRFRWAPPSLGSSRSVFIGDFRGYVAASANVPYAAYHRPSVAARLLPRLGAHLFYFDQRKHSATTGQTTIIQRTTDRPTEDQFIVNRNANIITSIIFDKQNHH